MLFIFYGTVGMASTYLWQNKLILSDYSSIGIIVSIIWAHLIYNNFARENRLKLQIKKQFEHYLAPAMVKRLQENPSLLKLGGETRELTFLFCDIRGFTPISEKFQDNPQGLTKVINKFLTPMTDIILKNGGTIDKYMGDCIMAFWNAPIDIPNHRTMAIRTAVEMVHKLKDLNNNMEFGSGNTLNIGIGINTGNCVVGNMGSDQRFDYSVIGDAVNLASRLESSSKTLGKTIVIGEDTRHSIETVYPFEYIDSITVKGKTEEIKVYTLSLIHI